MALQNCCLPILSLCKSSVTVPRMSRIYIFIYSIFVLFNFCSSKSRVSANLQSIHKMKEFSKSALSSESNILLRGGQTEISQPFVTKRSFSTIAWATWGILQVVTILGNAIKRVAPVAKQPWIQKDLLPYQCVLYGVWITYMMYAEGYEAFQLKFSPLLVKRAFLLNENKTFLKCLFAGPYSMGLFGATKKRMIVSWCVSLGVFSLVSLVKRLPYPWRSIIDAGVVAGLSYGAVATLVIFVRGLFNILPDVDPCLPERQFSESRPGPDLKIE